MATEEGATATFEGDDRQDNDETGEEQEGGKRARQDDEGANAKRLRSGDTASYLKTLLEEEIKIIPFATVLPECSRLLQIEIQHVRGGGAPASSSFRPPSPRGVPPRQGHQQRPNYSPQQKFSHGPRSPPPPGADLQMEMLEYRETSAGQCKSSFKVVVPVEKSPGFNFIGRLLGPRGNTLKDMQAQSGCKMTIRGKGSVKLKPGESEAQLAQQPQNYHLTEPLHVVVEWEGSLQGKENAFYKAEMLLREMCNPPESEESDYIKKNQLRELAMLNGTYKDDHFNSGTPRSGGRGGGGGSGGRGGPRPPAQQAYQQSGYGGNGAAAFPAGGMDPMTSAAFQQGLMMAQAQAFAQQMTGGSMGIGGMGNQQQFQSMPQADYSQYFGQY